VEKGWKVVFDRLFEKAIILKREKTKQKSKVISNRTLEGNAFLIVK